LGRYFVQYPIGFACNLQCSYCFHREHHLTGVYPEDAFTYEQFVAWRRHFLGDSEVIVHPHGGEPFCDENRGRMNSLLRGDDPLDILSNGVVPTENYRSLIRNPGAVRRIGLTYHRAVIEGRSDLHELFVTNVHHLADAGINVYVKELLLVDYVDDIAADMEAWALAGIPVVIQDFKGVVKGLSGEEYKRYTPKMLDMISREFWKSGSVCQCGPAGFTNVLIRGGWRSGDVVACWCDPVIVGNIQKMEYKTGYRIEPNLPSFRMSVVGVEKKYGGTRHRDLPVVCADIAEDSYIKPMREAV